MEMLLDGTWLDNDATAREVAKDGKFQRSESQFRSWVTADGSAGPTGEAGFAAEPGRYHLYLAHTCPWAHRALIMRELKGLQKMIGVSVVNPLMLENGWPLDTDFPDATGDELYGLTYLYELYLKANPDYSGRVTVPVLWYKLEQTFANN